MNNENFNHPEMERKSMETSVDNSTNQMNSSSANEVTNTNFEKSTSAEQVKGDLTFDDSGIQKIIGIALEEVDGLLMIHDNFLADIKNKLVNNHDVTEGVHTEVGEKEVAVDLDIVTEYGKDVTEIEQQIKEVLAREVKEMTGLEVIEVNLNVTDVKTREEFEAEQETVQDKLSQASSEKTDNN